MKILASLGKANVVVAIITVQGEFDSVDNPNIVEIKELESSSVLGKVWDGKKFIDNPNPPEIFSEEEVELQNLLKRRELLRKVQEIEANNKIQSLISNNSVSVG